MPKKDEPGFIEICCPDGRRGFWFRQTPSPTEDDERDAVTCPPAETIELAAGRPGDESLFALKPGHVVTEKDVLDLQSLVLKVKFAFDMMPSAAPVPAPDLVSSIEALETRATALRDNERAHWVGQEHAIGWLVCLDLLRVRMGLPRSLAFEPSDFLGPRFFKRAEASRGES